VVTLFKNATSLITNSPAGEGALGVIHQAAFVSDDDGRVAWVGEEVDVPESYATADAVDLEGCLVMPGWVECHTHLVFAGDRTLDYAARCRGVSYEEVAARGGGIRLSVRETRSASRETLLDLGRARLQEFLSYGVTTVEIKSGYGLSYEHELKCLEVIAQLAAEGPIRIEATVLGAHIVPDEYADRRSEYIAMLTERLLPEVARRKLARFVDVFCEVGAYTVAETREILTCAKNLGLGVKLHAEQLSRTGASQLAAEFGAVSADHLEYVDSDDAEALARAGTVAVLLPGAGLFLGGAKKPPVRLLLDAGVKVALSTDFNPGTCPSTHLPMMTTLGCSWLGLSPEEAIHGVTVNAARALALTDGRGSLAVGAPCDFSVQRIGSWQEIPYRFGHNAVEQVWVSGNRVF
jgi:imidazolonepropionase